MKPAHRLEGPAGATVAVEPLHFRVPSGGWRTSETRGGPQEGGAAAGRRSSARCQRVRTHPAVRVRSRRRPGHRAALAVADHPHSVVNLERGSGEGSRRRHRPTGLGGRALRHSRGRGEEPRAHVNRGLGGGPRALEQVRWKWSSVTWVGTLLRFRPPRGRSNRSGLGPNPLGPRSGHLLDASPALPRAGGEGRQRAQPAPGGWPEQTVPSSFEQVRVKAVSEVRSRSGLPVLDRTSGVDRAGRGRRGLGGRPSPVNLGGLVRRGRVGVSVKEAIISCSTGPA
jgi:hypothetical protein